MKKDKKNYQILVVEDNPGDFALIEEYLEEQILGPNIHRVNSFKQIKAQMELSASKYDVVLLDLTLPDKSGEELIAEMVPLFVETPIIVLTGYSDNAFGVKSLSMGISDYLLKDELTAASLYKSILYNIERKKTLSDLEESEKRYTELFHLSPLPMWVYELETLKFLDVNNAAVHHYGYTYDEFLSMTIKDIRPEEDLTILEEGIKASRASKHSFFHGLFRHKKKNGDIIKVKIQSDRFLFKTLESRIILSIDVTDQQNYIEAIEQQNEKLRQISWIQSHVVRAPLSRIMGLISLLKDFEIDENEKGEILNFILSSAEELDSIIAEIIQKTNEIEIDFKKKKE